MIIDGKAKSRNEIVGVVESVYEDLGPAHRVSVSEINGKGMYTFDVADFPFPADEVQSLVGKKVRIVTTFEVEILKP
jgi:hypothetical protein